MVHYVGLEDVTWADVTIVAVFIDELMRRDTYGMKIRTCKIPFTAQTVGPLAAAQEAGKCHAPALSVRNEMLRA